MTDESIFSRTAKLLGEDKVELLSTKTVAVFGLGGVGSYVAESLVRCGIGKIILIDKDTVSESNINRQLYALHSTVGKLKTEVAKERILDINPDIKVEVHSIFYTKETADQIDLSACDYIVDAIDTVTSKLLLIQQAKELDIPLISSMGTGNKLDPFSFKIDKIEKTSVCPLAKTIRYELKKRKIYPKKFRVLYSTEVPVVKTRPPASISFIPSTAGLMISSYVIKELIK